MKASDILIEQKELVEERSADRSPLILLEDDPPSAKLLVAWRLIRHIAPAEDLVCSAHPTARFEWLHKNWAFSYTEWLLMAGLPDKPTMREKAERLIRAKLVYPDGTLPRIVAEYLVRLSDASEEE